MSQNQEILTGSIQHITINNRNNKRCSDSIWEVILN